MTAPLPLFVYGTLRDADIVSAVLGRAVDIATLPMASAPGFAAVYMPGQVYPALIARPGAAAAGLMLASLSVADWAVLDAFEGDNYRRSVIAVVSHGIEIEAQAYRPVRVIDGHAPDWSLDHWQAHHKAQVLAIELDAAARARRH